MPRLSQVYDDVKKSAKTRIFDSRIGELLVKEDDDLDRANVLFDIQDNNLFDTTREVQAAYRDCNRLSKETRELCDSSVDKATEIVKFGSNIHDSLVGISTDGGMEASSLDLIADLVDGDIAHEARDLAGDMEDLALQCVGKSVDMITRMQQGVDALPKVVEDAVRRAANRVKISEEDERLVDIDDDVEELSDCIEAVKELKLMTAVSAGKSAYRGISDKADVCKTMFYTIRKFAEAVSTITDAFLDKNVKAVVSKVKDMLRCIRLSSLMKAFSQEVSKLIKYIIELFQHASVQLSGLFSALAHAKDCVAKCIGHAKRAHQSCRQGVGQGRDLIDKSQIVLGHFEKITKLNKGSIASLRSLVGDADIQEAVDLARSMDDTVEGCFEDVNKMIDSVKEGYEKLPPLVVEGVEDEAGGGELDGSRSSDPIVVGSIDRELAELDRSREAIVEADVISSIQASQEGFRSVVEKVTLCDDLLDRSQIFAEDSISTIESFLGTWNPDVFVDKVKEMRRLVHLGKVMKELTDQTLNLLRKNIDLMRTIIDKFDKVPGLDMADDALDMIDDATKLFKKGAKFWGKGR